MRRHGVTSCGGVAATRYMNAGVRRYTRGYVVMERIGWGRGVAHGGAISLPNHHIVMTMMTATWRGPTTTHRVNVHLCFYYSLKR